MKQGEFNKLGKYLQERRLHVGLTQAEVSKLSKVHVQFVSNWERGICAPPNHCFQLVMDLLKADRHKIVDLMVQDTKRSIEEKIFKKKKSKAG